MNERVAEVELVEGLRAEGRAGNHVVILDEPEKDGGTDQGPTPMQGLLAALGGCSVITMRLYAQRKGWKLEGAKARVRLVRPEKGEKGPPKLTQEIELTGDLDDEQRERLRTIAGRCPVHRIIDGPVESEEILV